MRRFPHSGDSRTSRQKGRAGMRKMSTRPRIMAYGAGRRTSSLPTLLGTSPERKTKRKASRKYHVKEMSRAVTTTRSDEQDEQGRGGVEVAAARERQPAQQVVQGSVQDQRHRDLQAQEPEGSVFPQPGEAAQGEHALDGEGAGEEQEKRQGEDGDDREEVAREAADVLPQAPAEDERVQQHSEQAADDHGHVGPLPDHHGMAAHLEHEGMAVPVLGDSVGIRREECLGESHEPNGKVAFTAAVSGPGRAAGLRLTGVLAIQLHRGEPRREPGLDQGALVEEPQPQDLALRPGQR